MLGVLFTLIETVHVSRMSTTLGILVELVRADVDSGNGSKVQ